MAENSHQDVVNQVQSADASVSVDVSASTIHAPAAAAANSDAPTSSNTELTTPALDKTIDGAASASQGDKTSSRAQEEASVGTSLGGSERHSSSQGNPVTGEIQQRATSAMSGDVSAPASVGQSTESDADVHKHDTPDSAGKAGEAPKYAVKKPSAFKSVSVTKNFLAKSGAPPSQLAKSPSDTTASSPTPSGTLSLSSARPRLVAKTASGHKLSMSTQLSNGIKPGRPAAPDPSDVWNKNRVQTTQATPKHLTDEELKQQYGIQLASIPVIDGDDKGNKWADIDDEEDDWAPEVIEWSDGSKVNLAEAEKAAAEQAKVAEETKKREDVVKVPRFAARTTPSLGPNATVLKVGNAAAQAKAGDASGKPTDKPTLVAKPVAPTPVKSPWAALPPVEKVPPVAISPVPSAAIAAQRSALAENQPPEQRGNTGWRAKEIAADDFSRMHRDAINGSHRELYNSQSGKYEPVDQNRRGSMKRDQHFRQPAVLQRPGPDHDMSMPGHGDSEDVAQNAYADRRPSVTQQSHDAQNLGEQQKTWRRPSNNWPTQARGGPPHVSSASPETTVPAETAKPQPPAQEQSAAPPLVDPIVEQQRRWQETVENQEKIRQASIIAARKRKEEEARKEAADRERSIKERLAKLGPPVEKPAAKEANDSARPQNAAEPKQAIDDSRSKATNSSEASRSPPKPPAPGTAVQQYGMIKVHPSPRPNGVSPVVNHANVLPDLAAPMERQGSGQSSSHLKHFGETPGPQDHRGISRSSREFGPREKFPEESSRWNMTQKAWERAGDVSNMPSTSNLWAPSGSLRTLGNGDFNLHPSRGGPFRQSQISPEQILPSPQSAPPPPLFMEPKGGPSPMQGHQPGSFARQYEAGPPFGHKSPIDAHPQPPSTQSRTPALPSPLVHGPSSQHGLPPPPSQLAPLPEPKLGVSAWNSFSTNAPDHDAVARARINQENAMRLAEAEARGQPMNRMITEKWKQTSSGEEAGSRRIVGVQTTTRSQPPGAPTTQSIGIVAEEPRQPPVSMPPQHPKSSKFQTMFKQLNQGPPVASKAMPLPLRPASPPLPPSESYEHPVYERTNIRPLVNLPGMFRSSEDRPVPVVRLPPAQPMPQNMVLGDSRLQASFRHGPSTPLAKTIDWQNRFNGLFKGSTAAQRLRESGDFSISKTGFDILSVSEAAAVSFPQPGQISPVSPTFSRRGLDTKSKSIEQETSLFDADLHPGSTPPVRVPVLRPIANWRPALTNMMAVKKTHQLQFRDQDITSTKIWIVGRDDYQPGKLDVTIRLPGHGAVSKKQMNIPLVKDPRAERAYGTQKSRTQAKPTRKVREASGAVQTASVNPTANIVAKPVAAPTPIAPQTWATRVSQASN